MEILTHDRTNVKTCNVPKQFLMCAVLAQYFNYNLLIF